MILRVGRWLVPLVFLLPLKVVADRFCWFGPTDDAYHGLVALHRVVGPRAQDLADLHVKRPKRQQAVDESVRQQVATRRLLGSSRKARSSRKLRDTAAATIASRFGDGTSRRRFTELGRREVFTGVARWRETGACNPGWVSASRWVSAFRKGPAHAPTPDHVTLTFLTVYLACFAIFIIAQQLAVSWAGAPARLPRPVRRPIDHRSVHFDRDDARDTTSACSAVASSPASDAQVPPPVSLHGDLSR